jgi:hypothetical protein
MDTIELLSKTYNSLPSNICVYRKSSVSDPKYVLLNPTDLLIDSVQPTTPLIQKSDDHDMLFVFIKDPVTLNLSVDEQAAVDLNSCDIEISPVIKKNTERLNATVAECLSVGVHS